MARYSHPSFDFYQQSPSTLDPKPSFPEEDEISVLDDKILDSTTSPDLSSSHRRSSAYDHHNNPLSSHRDSIWSDFSQPSTTSTTATTSSSSSHSHHHHHPSQVGHTMFESASSNPFMHASHPAASSSYTHHAGPWSLSRESGSCTPTPGIYEHFPSDLDGNSSAPFAGGAVGPVNAINIPPMSSYRSMAFGASGAVAMSPQSSQGWVPASTDMPDATARPTKSPSYRHTSPLSVRRDGIRKKNARFEIPAERTLSNIDHLIGQSTNDEEIKELKQQKRLLRNRQAA